MRISGKHPSLKRVARRKQISVRIHQTRSAAKTSPALKSAPARLAGSGMFSAQAWQEIARSLKLPGRELQLVRGLFDDQKELTIAIGLGVSAHTIHTHVQRLHRKLAVTDRSQLVLRVMQEFLALTTSPGSHLPSLCVNRTTGRCPLHPWRAVEKSLPGRRRGDESQNSPVA